MAAIILWNMQQRDFSAIEIDALLAAKLIYDPSTPEYPSTGVYYPDDDNVDPHNPWPQIEAFVDRLHRGLDDWLEAVQVCEPHCWENETGPEGWWAVCNDEGIIAYFGNSTDAYRFRLDYINRKLNP